MIRAAQYRRLAILAVVTIGGLMAAEVLRAEAGDSKPAPSAEQLVEDALRAEIDGNLAKRRVLLSVAIDAQPEFAPARWQSGQIRVGDEWKSVEEAQKSAADNPDRVTYQVLRQQASDNLRDQLILARWCDKHSLKDEAGFHWSNVLAYQPYNEEALQATNSCWYDGQRMTVDEAKAAKTTARERRKSARTFRPKVAAWTRMLEAGDLRSRNEALDEIQAVRDLAALPAIEEVTLHTRINTNSEFEHAHQIGLAIVDALSHVPDQAATESLLRHAAIAPVKSVRQAASLALKRRSPHGYVPGLLAMLTMPFESSFRMTTDSEGGVHYWHSLYREGRDVNLSIESRSSLIVHDFHGATILVGRDGEMDVAKESDTAIALRKARAARRSAANYTNAAAATERQVANVNSQTDFANLRVTSLLSNVTDQNFGNDPKAWWNWWDEYNEYSSDGERPTQEYRYVNTEIDYYRLPGYEQMPHSCFAAGTKVWTKTGLVAIESIEIGDFVLAQDDVSGELSYKTVLGRTVRRDRPTLTIQCGDETIQTTLGHPMWVAGRGWKMAKELKPGDLLHGVNGPVQVASAATAESIDVFNLVVADTHNYFVGEAGVLVHDNSPRRPTTSAVPGLAVALSE